jgi:ATP-dependent Clp protease ATP-binding subunit ClpX
MQILPHQRWPREVVIDHGDGTVSLLQDASISDGVIRGRLAGDVFRASELAMRCPPTPKTSYCSFCGKANHEAELMLAGPVWICICDECVEVAVETIASKRAEIAAERDAADAARCDCQHPETTAGGFAAVSVDCPIHGDA